MLADEHDEGTYTNVEAFVNRKVLALSHVAYFYNGLMHLDYKLVNEGISSSSDYIAFHFDGAVHTGSSEGEPEMTKFPMIPDFAHNLKSF